MSEAAIATISAQIEILTRAVADLARSQGTRLSRAAMCERFGVCSKTLTAMVVRGDAPMAGADGKWLLSEVLEWESQTLSRKKSSSARL